MLAGFATAAPSGPGRMQLSNLPPHLLEQQVSRDLRHYCRDTSSIELNTCVAHSHAAQIRELVATFGEVKELSVTKKQPPLIPGFAAEEVRVPFATAHAVTARRI